MKTTNRTRRLIPLVLAVAAGITAGAAWADDMASFATGGYAKGLRTREMMHMIDSNGDGMVSEDEWTAFQERVFAALDKDHSGVVDEKEFTGPQSDALAFATAGFSHGLKTNAMFRKIDTDNDGTISRDEFVKYQMKIFEMMDTGKKRMIGPTDFIRKGG